MFRYRFIVTVIQAWATIITPIEIVEVHFELELGCICEPNASMFSPFVICASFPKVHFLDTPTERSDPSDLKLSGGMPFFSFNSTNPPTGAHKCADADLETICALALTSDSHIPADCRYSSVQRLTQITVSYRNHKLSRCPT